MTDEAQAESAFDLIAGQPGGSVQYGLQVVAFGQFALLRGNAACDLFDLLVVGQVMLDDHEELLQLYWHLDKRRQDHDEGPRLLATADLLSKSLDDLR